MIALTNFIKETQGIELPADTVIPDDVLIKALHEVYDNVKGARKVAMLDQLYLARSEGLLKEVTKISKESRDTMYLQIPELRKVRTTVPAMMIGLSERLINRYASATQADIVLGSLMRERVIINQRYLDKVNNDQLPGI